MARYSLDSYKENRETTIGRSYTKEPRGAYGLINLGRYERNIDVLATYNKRKEDFSLSVSAGANSRDSKFTDVSNASRNGTGLIIPGLFTL
jgi:hypothetical protein